MNESVTVTAHHPPLSDNLPLSPSIIIIYLFAVIHIDFKFDSNVLFSFGFDFFFFFFLDFNFRVLEKEYWRSTQIFATLFEFVVSILHFI